MGLVLLAVIAILRPESIRPPSLPALDTTLPAAHDLWATPLPSTSLLSAESSRFCVQHILLVRSLPNQQRDSTLAQPRLSPCNGSKLDLRAISGHSGSVVKVSGDVLGADGEAEGACKYPLPSSFNESVS